MTKSEGYVATLLGLVLVVKKLPANVEDVTRKKAEERIYGEFLDWYYEYHAGKPRASSQRQEQSR